jgi:hypothetical protein
MKKKTKHKCGVCAGKGWLLIMNTDTHALEIQRCDECGRYESDSEVQSHIANNVQMLAAVIIEYCAALVDEVGQSLKTHEKDDAATRWRLIKTLRSLPNALGFHVKGDEVGAQSEDSAKELVRVRAPGVLDNEFREYRHERDPDTWSAEVKP